MLKRFLLVIGFFFAANSYAELFGFGEYDGRLLSETGRVNRDLNLLLMKSHRESLPFLIAGGDLITFARYPKRLRKPLYLFNEISAELQNARLNAMLNPSDTVFFQANYQVNEKRLLDAFMTVGNLNKSPLYFTVGRQYLSYGDFNKYDVEPNPLTKSMFRIIEPAASFGFYKNDCLIKSMVSDRTSRYGFLLQKRLSFATASHTIGVGYLNDINNSNKALTVLETQKHLSVFNMYDLIDVENWSFRVELSNALGKIETIDDVKAYDAEGFYRFKLFGRPTKIIASTSGVWPKRLKFNNDFKQLGLFVSQYVLSLKHQVRKHITLGGAFIWGYNESLHRQAAVNLVVKF